MTGKPKTSLAMVVPVGFCAATVTVWVDNRTEVLVTVKMRSSNLKAGLWSAVTLSSLFDEAATHLSTGLSMFITLVTYSLVPHFFSLPPSGVPLLGFGPENHSCRTPTNQMATPKRMTRMTGRLMYRESMRKRRFRRRESCLGE